MKRRLIKKIEKRFFNRHLMPLLLEAEYPELKHHVTWYKKFLKPTLDKRVRKRELVKGERTPFGRLVKVLDVPVSKFSTDNLLRLASWPDGRRFYIQEDSGYTLIIMIENGEKVAWEVLDHPRKVRPFLESFDWNSVNRAVNFLSEAEFYGDEEK